MRIVHHRFCSFCFQDGQQLPYDSAAHDDDVGAAAADDGLGRVVLLPQGVAAGCQLDARVMWIRPASIMKLLPYCLPDTIDH